MREKISIKRKNNFVELTADDVAVVYLNDGKEVFKSGRSQYLDEYMCDRIDLSKLNKFIAITCLIPNGNENSVTNFKGIWGLINHPKGIYKNCYFSKKGKVYFGITDKIENATFNGFIGYIEIYIPKSDIFPNEQVFQMFSTAKFDFTGTADKENIFFADIQRNIPDSVIIHNTGSSIKLFGDKIEQFFQ